MSQRGRSEQVTVLRGAIARIEGSPSAFGFAGTAADKPVGRVRLGHDLALDGAMGGGLARGWLSEVVAHRPGDAGAASGFALALAARFAAADSGPAGSGSAGSGAVVWVVEDGARTETGMPYAPGLAAHGIDPARLVVVRAASGAEGLWATEEALKCRAVAAVVLDLWRTKLYDLVASRRLVLAAGASGTPGIVVAAGAPGSARALCSAAQTRFEVAAAPGQPAAGTRLPLPGRAAWAVRLARIRAGPAGAPAGFDWEKVWPLVWDHQEARLCDALPVPPSAHPRDRPHPAAARERAGRAQGDDGREDRGHGWRAA